MPFQFADGFFDIPTTLEVNPELRSNMIKLIEVEPMPGKVLEDANGQRMDKFRGILTRLTCGETDLDEAIRDTITDLPRDTSPYASNNRVFSHGWNVRLVRTQFSRFYNQAVLVLLKANGVELCYIPHSDEEKPDSPCTKYLAGNQHKVEDLYRRLVRCYADGDWSVKEPKVPDHPHCTHVVKPLSDYGGD